MRFATADDKELIEAICNDAQVRKWTVQDGGSDFFADDYLNPQFHCKVVLGDRGCFLGHNIGYGKYIVHTNLLPELRGSKALRAANEAVRMMFLETDCVELLTMVPRNNPQARWFTTAMGFKSRFTRKNAWLSGGELHDMDYFYLTMDNWIASGKCEKQGQEFHARLDERNLLSHEEDNVHDSYVGACYEMIKNGLVAKGIIFYNIWAIFAGYATIKVESEDPLIIDIRTCKLSIANGTFHIL